MDGKLDLIVANFNSNYVSVLLGNGNGTFQAQRTFATGVNPNSVAVADVNGDGKPDLIVTNFSGPGTVGVFLGNGDGTFQAQRTFATGVEPYYATAADLNGDGKLDLVATNYQGTLSVLLGNGDGTFQAQQTFATGKWPRFAEISDLNGDGKPDLVVTSRAGNFVGVLLGNGNGTFQKQQTFAVGTDVESVAVSDLNSDGKPDLVVANFDSGSVGVLLGNGNGTFQTQQTFLAGTGALSVAVSDVNGDSKPDILVANAESDSLSVLLGNGNGTFQLQQTFGVGRAPTSVAVADLNGDGQPDVVVTNMYGGGVSVLLGSVPLAVQSIDRVSPPGPLTSDATVNFAVVFNEPASGVSAANFSLALNGVATENPLVVEQITPAVYEVIVTGVSGTGTLGLDLVDDGSILDAAGNPLHPGPTAAFSAQQTFPSGSGPISIATADLNRDGKADLVVANFHSNNVSVLLGNGNGTFQAQQTFATGTNAFSVVVADVNRDGKPDLVVANEASGNVSILLGNGDGTFKPQQTFATGAGSDSVTVADLNGDGKLDLVVANCNSNTLSVLLGNGDGTFKPEQTFATGNYPFSVAISDVNGDGKSDLVVANAHANNVGVLLGNGDGTFQAQQTFATGANPDPVTVADVNGDGKPDLILANDTLSGSVSVLLGNGNGTFQAQQTFATGTRPFSVVVSDLNGDGRPDLLVANYGTPQQAGYTVSVLLGNGDGTFQSQQTFATGTRPDSVAVADLNEDGRPDILVANFSSGTIGVLSGIANGNFTGQNYTIVPSLDTITGTGSIDQITLMQDPDQVHIDWTINSTIGQMLITDPNGLTINGNAASNVITLDYSNGIPLPNILHLDGTFTINGLTGSNPLANTNLEIGQSTVYIPYANSASDPLAAIRGYLNNGYSNGLWTGTPTPTTGVITSTAAAASANKSTGIGYADSADGLVSLPANTIELKYTLYGDTGLTGSVGFTDFMRMTQHYTLNSGATWGEGDFNYDGSINSADFNLLQPNYGQTLPAPAVAPTVTPPATSSRSVRTPIVPPPVAPVLGSEDPAATPLTPSTTATTVTKHKTKVEKTHKPRH